MENLVRANKLTVYHAGDGLMKGIFYKTNKKLGVITSTDEKVLAVGYKEPVGIDAGNPDGLDAVQVTPSDKLEAFRQFLIVNCTCFGFIYDPVDRRPENERYPNSYDADTMYKVAKDMVVDILIRIVNECQDRYISKLIDRDLIPPTSTISCHIISNTNIDMEIKCYIDEHYKSGKAKYGNVIIPISFGVMDKATDVKIEVHLVSGQLKKPRVMGDYVLTPHGLFKMLTDKGVIPQIPKDEGGDENDKITECDN